MQFIKFVVFALCFIKLVNSSLLGVYCYLLELCGFLSIFFLFLLLICLFFPNFIKVAFYLHLSMQRKSIVNTSASLTLIIINVVIYLFQIAIPKITEMFKLTSAIVWHQPWTLVTAMFLHGSFSHLLFNMYALLLFGPLVERKIGVKRFLVLYFVSGIVASLAALYYPSALGASGAIMGVLGMVIMLFPDLRVLFFFVIPMSMRTAGIIFAAIDLLGFFAGGSSVAHLAHLAGLAVGIGYGYYLLTKKKKFIFNFTAKSNPSGPEYSSVRSRTQKSSANSNSSYEQTIELTKDDIDNYYKYGKL